MGLAPAAAMQSARLPDKVLVLGGGAAAAAEDRAHGGGELCAAARAAGLSAAAAPAAGAARACVRPRCRGQMLRALLAPLPRLTGRPPGDGDAEAGSRAYRRPPTGAGRPRGGPRAVAWRARGEISVRSSWIGAGRGWELGKQWYATLATAAERREDEARRRGSASGAALGGCSALF